MKWNNLTKNKCPKCNKDLLKAWNSQTNMFDCKCGFSIGQARMSKIISDIVSGKLNQIYEEEKTNN